MSRVLPLAVAVPLLAAAISTLSRRGLQRVVSFSTTTGLLVFGVLLVAATRGGDVLATQVGGWPAPYAIPFAADLLSALMLTVSALMVLVCTAFATARGEDDNPLFHTLVLGLTTGLAGSFLTADLFNLFVFFEVMLIASYVMLVLKGTKTQVRGGVVYVTTNMLASFVLLVGVALVYGETGTVNIAELGETVRTTGTVAVAAALLLAAFAVKSALVPVHGWLPTAYPATSPGVAALFSGLLTKVGVYALYRVYTAVFAGEPTFRPVLLVLAGFTMLVGVLGALGREEMRTILSFHITSQIGYMIAGLGLFGPLGLAAGIFYMLHHIVVKTGLFLCAGAVETLYGTGLLDRLGGLARRRSVLATAFVVLALSLAGLPPLSGFFGKVLLVQAAVVQASWGTAAVMVGVSLFTLVSMVKIWNGVFWGDDPQAGASVEAPPRASALIAPAAVCAVVTVVLGFTAWLLHGLVVTAAEVLLDPSIYADAVLQR